MANWCYNNVTFEGEYLLILQIKRLFEIMAEKEQEEQQGQLPDWLNANEGYFFEICWDECDILTYQTKCTPNIDQLIEIAKEYGCDLECQYEELGGLKYGIATYIGGIRNDIYLETEDFEKFSFDPTTDQYHFGDSAYKSELDILEILLQEKLTTQL